MNDPYVDFDDSDIFSPIGLSKGYKARNYDDTPEGSLSFAMPFPSNQLIPMDEVIDRIRTKEKYEATLVDTYLRQLARGKVRRVLNQNGIGYCVDEKTEVLTEYGWTPWKDYDWGKYPLVGTMNPATQNLEFQRPMLKHAYEYEGPMIYSTNRRIDFAVTPDHRMLTRKWDEPSRQLSDSFQFQRAADLGWYFGLPHSTRGWLGTELKEVAIEGDRSYNGDDFVCLLALLASDGYAGGSDSTENWVSFCCFDPRWRERTAAIAARCGFREQSTRPGVWRRTDAGVLAAWIRANLYVGGGYKASNKCVPSIIKWVSARQIALFLDYFGDRTHSPKDDNEPQFFSASRRIMDDLQELFLRIGKRCSICEDDPKTAYLKTGQAIHGGKSYTLCVSKTDRLSIDRKKHLETEHYKGMVYCTTVPNGTLVTRRNGSVLISGNCHAFSPTIATRVLRSQQGLDDVELSASSVGGPVTNFTNSGAYIFNDLAHIAKYGICPEKIGDREIYPMTTTKNHWNAEAKQLAAANICEEYWEGTNRDDHAFLSCLLTDKPCCGGWNWWGHAVTDFWVTYLESNRTLYYLGANSWDVTWSYGLEVFRNAPGPQAKYADLAGWFAFPVGTVSQSGQIKLGKYGRYCGTPDEWYALRSIKSSQIEAA